jgi:hypothetical protein
MLVDLNTAQKPAVAKLLATTSCQGGATKVAASLPPGY